MGQFKNIFPLLIGLVEVHKGSITAKTNFLIKIGFRKITKYKGKDEVIQYSLCAFICII